MSKINLLNESFVDIWLDKTNGIVVAKWMGFLRPSDVRKGCDFMTQYFKENNVKGHLSDHRELKVLSKEVQDYLTTTWFPQVEKVGLRKCGAVVAKDFFAAASVNRVNQLANIGQLQINTFDSESECVKWIQS